MKKIIKKNKYSTKQTFKNVNINTCTRKYFSTVYSSSFLSSSSSALSFEISIIVRNNINTNYLYNTRKTKNKQYKTTDCSQKGEIILANHNYTK
jgi:hypothetical protein